LEERKTKDAQWWGATKVPHGHCVRWQIGPLTLWGQRLSGEWRIARSSQGDVNSSEIGRVDNAACEDLLAHDSLTRFGVSGKDETLVLMPALADRAVVSTPERPFYVPAGEEVTVYLGTPLWLQLLVGKQPLLLEEFAMHQPSDTWFGSSPQEGEICYASRSFCRLQLSAMHRLPHRSSTAVLIQNHASTPLFLERIKLPVPYLSLYSDPSDSDLWTNDIVLERIDGELGPLRVRDGAPRAIAGATLVAEARQQAYGNVMVRAFTSFFADKIGSE
jgi:hypothetical protein